ncbi:MAG TPA: acetyl-CoA acetyltransferase, partial [Dehalococcoidia bacterium]|nr:acetyl-CoA acetyltransferase [Dehalococcoidia bacterium]
WIVEPFRLFDCCQENDGAAALILMPADRAKDFKQDPAYILGVATGVPHRAAAGVHNAPDYASANFKSVAPHMYNMAKVAPSEVQVAQVYENFTGGVVMSIIEHDLCTYETANEVISFDNLIASSGKLPLNTSGGNLAECYMHGLELQIEAIRQIRGQSPNQVADVNVSLVASGPMVEPVSDVIFGSEATL